MKKICIFTGFFLPHLGGVERYTSKLSKELYNMGYQVTIVTSNDGNHLDEEDLKYAHLYRLPVHNLFKNRYPLLKKNTKFRELMKKIEDEDADYYICNTRFYLTTLLGIKLAKKKDKIVHIIEHGSGHFSVGNKVLDLFGQVYEHMLTSVIKHYKPKFYGVSNCCNRWLRHFKIEANGIFYNAIDEFTYDEFKDKKYKRDFGSKTVITFIGRIIKEKGIYLVLDACRSLAKKYDDIVLVVAGDGPELEKVKKIYTDDFIYFEGKLNHEEIMALLNRTDIFTSPSLYPEGLPTTVLEAGIMKCALIATNRGGTIEVINEETMGIIMEETEESLEKNLTYLLDNPKRMNILKENLFARIKTNFTWKNTAKTVELELTKSNSNKRETGAVKSEKE